MEFVELRHAAEGGRCRTGGTCCCCFNAAASGAGVAAAPIAASGTVSDIVTVTVPTVYGFRPLRPHEAIGPGRRRRPFVFP